jgi:hypothetical protein
MPKTRPQTLVSTSARDSGSLRLCASPRRIGKKEPLAGGSFLFAIGFQAGKLASPVASSHPSRLDILLQFRGMLEPS